MSAAPRTILRTLRAQGFDPIPIGKRGDPKAPVHKNWTHRTFSDADWRPWHGIGLRCGRQRDGYYFYVIDQDNRPEQGIDASAEYKQTLDRLPSRLAAKLVTARSTGGAGRYIIFKSRREIPSGQLYNTRGQKIGDFLGLGRQVVMPTPDRMLQHTLADAPLLDDANTDMVLLASGYRSAHHDTPRESAIDWAEVEHCLGNVDGILKRIKPHTLTYQQLHGDGGADRSRMRWGLAHELRKRYGLPDEEIAALLLHFDFGHLQEKGSKWLTGDIEQCIADANALYPDVIVNRSRCLTASSQPLPEVERPKRGRPTRLTDDTYLAWLKRRANGANQAVMLTQTEIAAAHKVHVLTIRRIEKRLQEQGSIARETVRKGRQTYSYVTILSVNKNTAVVVPSVLTTPSETAHHNAENCAPAVLKEEHTVEIAHHAEPIAADVSLRLADAVRAALEAVAGDQRLTFPRFLATFREYFPQLRLSDKPLKREYDRVLNERRRERTLDKERAKAASAEQDDLKRWAKSYAWNQTKAVKDGHDRKAYMWGCKLAVLEQEIERRQAAGEWLDKKSRRRKHATPLPAPQLALAEAAPLAPEDDEGLSGRCVPPFQPQAVAQPVIASMAVDWAYLQRLYTIGELTGIERHCYGRAPYSAVLARLHGGQYVES